MCFVFCILLSLIIWQRYSSFKLVLLFLQLDYTPASKERTSPKEIQLTGHLSIPVILHFEASAMRFEGCVSYFLHNLLLIVQDQ